MFFFVAAVLAALAGLAQINVWLYGPFRPEVVTTAAQPDWYVGWLEGALRLIPAWEPRIFGIVRPTPSSPGHSSQASPSSCSTPGRSSRPGSPATPGAPQLLGETDGGEPQPDKEPAPAL